jgi:hypothetical protein
MGKQRQTLRQAGRYTGTLQAGARDDVRGRVMSFYSIGILVCVGSGCRAAFCPPYDAGALNPGCMPLFVVLIAAPVLAEKPATAQKIGLSLILSGTLMIICWRGTAWSISRSFGDTLFLVASILTACFTVIMRQAKLDPIHAAALVSTGSLAIYAPIYLPLHGFHLAEAPLLDLRCRL